MVREIKKEDYQLYMDLSREFYDSDAVLHSIPASYREETWKEMMRSEEFVKGYILEKDGIEAGYGLTSYTFPRKPAEEWSGWKNYISVLNIAAMDLEKSSPVCGRKGSPTVKRLRLEIEPDNLRRKNCILLWVIRICLTSR